MFPECLLPAAAAAALDPLEPVDACFCLFALVSEPLLDEPGEPEPVWARRRLWEEEEVPLLSPRASLASSTMACAGLESEEEEDDAAPSLMASSIIISEPTTLSEPLSELPPPTPTWCGIMAEEGRLLLLLLPSTAIRGLEPSLVKKGDCPEEEEPPNEPEEGELPKPGSVGTFDLPLEMRGPLIARLPELEDEKELALADVNDMLGIEPEC